MHLLHLQDKVWKMNAQKQKKCIIASQALKTEFHRT